MNVELPKSHPYGALFVVGRRMVSANTAQEIGSIIVKAGYLLLANSTGADTHRLVPDPEAASSELLLADQRSEDTITREADIAPYKPVADVVIEGMVETFPRGALLKVDGTTWLTRAATEPSSGDFFFGDRRRNLFGYEPRGQKPRADEGGNPLRESLPDPLEFPLRSTVRELEELNGYQNLALNFHRRGGGFVASSAIARELHDGQRICLHHLDPEHGDPELFSVTLALPPLHALYRTYCGHGPDKAPHWTRIRLGAMRADTLILRPEAGRAELLWRAHWPWRDQPAQRYRAVRVGEGSA